MISLKILLSAFCSVLLIGSSLSKTSNHQTKIVGGFKAKLAQIPYQVSIRNPSNSHFCGGSILNSKYILTAAHCCIYSSDKITIVSGTINLREGTRSEVEAIYKHESYDPRTLRNDIALIKLVHDLEFSELIAPVKLRTSEHLATGTSCLVSGWGTLAANSMIPSIDLMMVYVYAIDHNECAKAYEQLNAVSDKMFCAAHPGGGKDACQGDSGGPLVCEDLLSGIVSWGNSCADPLYPGVYTRISDYLDWLNKIMCDYDNSITNSTNKVLCATTATSPVSSTTNISTTTINTKSSESSEDPTTFSSGESTTFSSSSPTRVPNIDTSSLTSAAASSIPQSEETRSPCVNYSTTLKPSSSADKSSSIFPISSSTSPLPGFSTIPIAGVESSGNRLALNKLTILINTVLFIYFLIA